MAVGIICEFNPFHNGHMHLLSSVKAMCGGEIFCAMSGNFVQRGEHAAYDKHIRAKWAQCHGADVVAEIPFPFSCATAEKFAAAGVSVISASGVCDSIAFGAEDGDALCGKDFFETAQILLDKKCSDGIKKLVKQHENLGFAAARELYIRDNFGEKHSRLLARPNTLLGVEYAKAILSQNAKLDITVIPRIGQHDGVPEGNFSSASFLRENNSAENFAKYCPNDVAEYASANMQYTVDDEKYFAALCAKLLFADKSALCEISELPRDYVPRLIRAASECRDIYELTESVKSRHITNAKLRRMLLYVLTDTKRSCFDVLPKSAALLAYSPAGAALLRRMKKQKTPDSFCVVSRMSDINKLPPPQREIFKKQLAAERLFELLMTGKS